MLIAFAEHRHSSSALQVACLLLPLSFAYDIFWVFIQPKLTHGDSVMVKVCPFSHLNRLFLSHSFVVCCEASCYNSWLRRADAAFLHVNLLAHMGKSLLHSQLSMSLEAFSQPVLRVQCALHLLGQALTHWPT